MTNRKINIQNQKISYTLKTSRRARRMRLAIYCDGSFVAVRPRGMQEELVEKFILAKAEWVLSKLAYFKKFKNSLFVKNDRKEYLARKVEALEFVQERVEYFNRFYDFTFNRINIRNQRTRWGSCSRKGNLNFNYKILFLSASAADYLVVHELCHLEEFNHSTKFWQLVAKTVPNYRKVRGELKK